MFEIIKVKPITLGSTIKEKGATIVKLDKKQIEFDDATKTLDEYIKEAKEKYLKLHGGEPDVMKGIEIKLPNAVDEEGKEIDINKFLEEKQAFIPVMECGKILLVVTVQNKNGKPMFSKHTFEANEAPIMVRGVHNESPVIILPTMKYTEFGLQEKE